MHGERRADARVRGRARGRPQRTGNHDLDLGGVRVVGVVEEQVDVTDHADRADIVAVELGRARGGGECCLSLGAVVYDERAFWRTPTAACSAALTGVSDGAARRASEADEVGAATHFRRRRASFAAWRTRPRG